MIKCEMIRHDSDTPFASIKGQPEEFKILSTNQIDFLMDGQIKSVVINYKTNYYRYTWVNHVAG